MTKQLACRVLCSWVALAAARCIGADLNGFDLSGSPVTEGQVVSGGVAKDGIPALDMPHFVSGRQADFLKADDLVVGVTVKGDSRAYPLRILVWHEVANDTVGGQPVAVTYCPLCHSVLVFNRTVGGQVRRFGVSGLLHNSNVLLYDRQSEASSESLWSQGAMRAISGPAEKRGLELELLPSELTTWRDWATRFPATKVLSNETGHKRPYRRKAYADYFSSDRILFPVERKRERPRGVKDKDLMAVLYTSNGAKAYAVKDVKKAGGKKRALVDRVGDRLVKLSYIKNGDTVRVEPLDNGQAVPVAYMFWFALSAMQPGVEVFEPR